MADAAIFDLTAETVLTASHEFVTQDTSAATRAQAATFALMGGLAYTTASVTTANVTATVGTLHGLDLSGLTADRNFVLPDSAQVGERVGVFITVGDASFELDMVTAATGSLINGANAGGGTSWSRVFLDNECVIFRCINAGGAGDTDWIVEYDGRRPQRTHMEATGSQAVAASTETTVEVGEALFDVGDIADTVNDRVIVRRNGQYLITGFCILASLADGIDMFLKVKVGGTTIARIVQASPGSTGACGIAGSLTYTLSAGDVVTLDIWHSDSVSRNTNYNDSDSEPYLDVSEIL